MGGNTGKNGRNRKSFTKVRAKRMLAALLAVLLLTGCGATSSMDQKADTSAPETAPGVYNTSSSTYGENVSAGSAMEYPEEEYGEAKQDPGMTGTDQDNQTGNRKLIKTVDMDVETKQFQELLTTIADAVRELGGYIQNQNTYNGSAYAHYRASKSATLVIRIPKDRLEEFLGKVSDVGNVTRYSDNVEDVTLAYVDLESHRNALRTEQSRLLELLEKAESLEDILTIESRLSDLRYQLEGMESRLRTYDNQVEYSTVTMDISEVQELTPVQEQTDLERIGEGFMESLRDITGSMKEAGIWCLIHLPYGILWTLVILLVVFVFRRARRKKAARIPGQVAGQAVQTDEAGQAEQAGEAGQTADQTAQVPEDTK